MNNKAASFQAFQLRNFRPFVDTGWIKVKPITLLFGHNSSGKTALLSSLPMFKQTLEDPNPRTPFLFSSETGVDLGLFEEVSHRKQVSLDKPVWFNFEIGLVETQGGRFRYGPESYLRAIDILELDDRIQIEIAVNYNKKRRQIAITDMKIQDINGKRILRAFRKTTAENQRWHIEPRDLEAANARISFFHFLPGIFGAKRQLSQTPNYSAIRDVILFIERTLIGEFRSLVHVGPFRAPPRRAYRQTGESPINVGLAGEYWLNVFMQFRRQKKLAFNVNEWLDRLGYRIKVDWGRQGYVHPMLVDKSGLAISLKDVGFGISQMLPLLVQGFTSSPGSILILEQPEIHLHPRAQAELGDLLLAIAKRGVRLLIETHSEHLLLRMRRRLAEFTSGERTINAFKREDIAIYFIEGAADHSIVHHVQLDDLGNFVDPPIRFKSFFSSDYEEVMRWSNLVAKTKQGKIDEDSN